MNKTTEALKLAEEALEGWKEYDTWTDQQMWNDDDDEALAAIREALAEQEKLVPKVSHGLCGGCAKTAADGWALYCVECWEKAEPVKQEPVAFALYSGWARKAVYFSEIEACDQRDRRQLTADLGGSLEAYRVVPLIRAHGAKGE